MIISGVVGQVSYFNQRSKKTKKIKVLIYVDQFTKYEVDIRSRHLDMVKDIKQWDKIKLVAEEKTNRGRKSYTASEIILINGRTINNTILFRDESIHR